MVVVMARFAGRGMLFGIWPRLHPDGTEHCSPVSNATRNGNLYLESMRYMTRFFDRFDIKKAAMLGWWEDHNGVAADKPLTYVTAYRHPRNGVLLAAATWLEPPIAWMEMSLQISLRLDRAILGLPKGRLAATDIISGEDVDIEAPVGLPDAKFGRLIWVRNRRLKW